MFCSKCGKEITEGALFCPDCGANFSEEKTQMTQSAGSENAPAKKRKKVSARKVIAGIFVILCVLVIASASMKKKETEEVLKQLKGEYTVKEALKQLSGVYTVTQVYQDGTWVDVTPSILKSETYQFLDNTFGTSFSEKSYLSITEDGVDLSGCGGSYIKASKISYEKDDDGTGFLWLCETDEYDLGLTEISEGVVRLVSVKIDEENGNEVVGLGFTKQ
jgi:uncharacterized membrane protein YvbJ